MLIDTHFNAGIGSIYCTCYADPRLHNNHIDYPVVLTDSNTVGLGRPGDRIFGVVRDIENRDNHLYAVVQIAGFATIPLSLQHIVIGAPVCIGLDHKVTCCSAPFKSILVSFDEKTESGVILL